MKRIFCLLIFLVIIVFKSFGFSPTVTHTNPTNYGCSDGTVTINAASYCGGFGVFIPASLNGCSGPYGCNLAFNNGSHTITGFYAGTYILYISEYTCCDIIGYNPNNGQPIYSCYGGELDTVVVTISQPTCNTIATIDSIVNISENGCLNGKIAINGFATDCISQPAYYSARIYASNGIPVTYYESRPSGTGILFTGIGSGLYYAVVEGPNCNDTTPVIQIIEPSTCIPVYINSIKNTCDVTTNDGAIYTSLGNVGCSNTAYSYNLLKEGLMISTGISFSNNQSFTSLNSGSYQVEIIRDGCHTSSPIASINVSPPSNCNNVITVSQRTLCLKFLISGYYRGNGKMANVLMSQGVGSNPNITDSVTIELRTPTVPYDLIANTNSTVDTNGNLCWGFYSSITGNYYIVIRQRNGLETWSSIPVYISSNPTYYDFTNSSSKAYGDNMVQVDPYKWAFYSGDLNYDENIDLIDLSELENDISEFQYGYQSSDLNGDGNVDLLDSPIIETNVNGFIYSNHP